MRYYKSFVSFIKCLPEFPIKPQGFFVFKCVAQLVTATQLFSSSGSQKSLSEGKLSSQIQWQFFTKHSTQPFQASLICLNFPSQELKGKAEETSIGKYFDVIDPDDKLNLSTCQAQGMVQKHLQGNTGS